MSSFPLRRSFLFENVSSPIIILLLTSMWHLASVYSHSLDSQNPSPVLFFRSVYSDNSLGLLSFAYLHYLCLFISILCIPYSFETVFYLFIVACKPHWLLAIIACHLKTAMP